MAIGPTIIMHSYIVILHKAQQSRSSASIGHSLMMRFLLLFALLSIFFLLLSQNLVSSHGALCTATGSISGWFTPLYRSFTNTSIQCNTLYTDESRVARVPALKADGRRGHSESRRNGHSGRKATGR